MHYQVVARPYEPTGAWDYYPYWAPVRDKAAATRLATYAAQSGCEAAILQSVTAEMLHHIAHGVVARQDTQLLPALRYLPGARVAATSQRPEHTVETTFQLATGLDPYVESSNKAELDRRRRHLEMGAGGDIIQRAAWQREHIRFPLQMDVLRHWIALSRRVASGTLGGPTDGAPLGAAKDEESAPSGR